MKGAATYYIGLLETIRIVHLEARYASTTFYEIRGTDFMISIIFIMSPARLPRLHPVRASPRGAELPN